MDVPDELYALKNNFWCGHFKVCALFHEISACKRVYAQALVYYYTVPTPAYTYYTPYLPTTYQQNVLETAGALHVRDSAQQDLKSIYVARAQIALGQAHTVLDTLPESKDMFKAVRIHAEVAAGRATPADALAKLASLDQAEPSGTVRLLSAITALAAGNATQAYTLLGEPSNVEQAALRVQILLAVCGLRHARSRSPTVCARLHSTHRLHVCSLTARPA